MGKDSFLIAKADKWGRLISYTSILNLATGHLGRAVQKRKISKSQLLIKLQRMPVLLIFLLLI
jgi:hypothetical protein